MTDFINTAESGLADELDVTTANSSAGSAGTGFTINRTAGAVFKFDSAAAARHRGGLGYRVSGADVQVSRGEVAIGPAASCALAPYYNIPAYPVGGEFTILAARTGTSGATSSVFMNITTAGLLRLYDAAGAAIWISTNPVPLDAFWRPSIAMAKGTTTANGTVRGAVYYGAQLESATPTESGPTTPTARNAGIVDYTQLRFGKVGSGLIFAFTGVDDIQWSDTRSDHMPPVSSALPVNIFTRETIVRINAAGSSGSPDHTLIHVSGPSPASIIEPTPSSFEVTLPEPMASAIELDLVATNGAGTDTDRIVISPTGGSVTSIVRDFAVMGSGGVLV